MQIFTLLSLWDLTRLWYSILFYNPIFNKIVALSSVQTLSLMSSFPGPESCVLISSSQNADRVCEKGILLNII